MIAISFVQIEKSGKPVDLMHYHHAWDGFYEGRWADAKAAYKKIMRDPSVMKLVTVMREPVSHYMSYYYYFLQPETGVRRNVGIPSAAVACVWMLQHPPALKSLADLRQNANRGSERNFPTSRRLCDETLPPLRSHFPRHGLICSIRRYSRNPDTWLCFVPTTTSAFASDVLTLGARSRKPLER